MQYPGVADSFHSDIDNLVLVTKPLKLPDQLFLPKLIDFARRELTRECDYSRELKANLRMKEYLKDDDAYFVPNAYADLSSDKGDRKLFKPQFFYKGPRFLAEIRIKGYIRCLKFRSMINIPRLVTAEDFIDKTLIRGANH